MPTKATSAAAASASVGRISDWPCISARSSGELRRRPAAAWGNAAPSPLRPWRRSRCSRRPSRPCRCCRSATRRVCCGQAIGGRCSIAALSVRPVPIAITIGFSPRSQRVISAAPASASPVVPASASGSRGTTSARDEPEALGERAPRARGSGRSGAPSRPAPAARRPPATPAAAPPGARSPSARRSRPASVRRYSRASRRGRRRRVGWIWSSNAAKAHTCAFARSISKCAAATQAARRALGIETSSGARSFKRLDLRGGADNLAAGSPRRVGDARTSRRPRSADVRSGNQGGCHFESWNSAGRRLGARRAALRRRRLRAGQAVRRA